MISSMSSASSALAAIHQRNADAPRRCRSNRRRRDLRRSSGRSAPRRSSRGARAANPALARDTTIRIGRLVAAQIHRRWRALEDVQLLRVFADERHALNRRCTGADDRDALVGQLRQPAVVVAAGVVVVPTRRVERVPLEVLDAGNAGQLRPVRGSGRLNRRSARACGRCDSSRRASARVLEPSHLGDAGLEDRVVVEPEVLADALRVLVDLRRERVLLLRHVAGFFEQRQVAVRLDVALRARIAVPVPGAAEIAAGFDDAEVRDAPLLEARTGHQAAETAADDRHVDVQVERLAREIRFDVRIVLGVVRELRRRLDVLVLAVGAQPLVALAAVLLAQRLRIEIEVRKKVVQSCSFGAHLAKLALLVESNADRE